MTPYFWIIVAIGAVGGILLSLRWMRDLSARIALGTPQPNKISRAGDVAGVVATLPALFFAVVLGGNFGGSIAASTVGALAVDPFVSKIFIAIGAGGGIFLVLVFIVLSSAAAGATFMKVYLARNSGE